MDSSLRWKDGPLPQQATSPQRRNVTQAQLRHPSEETPPQRRNVIPAEAGASLTHSIVRTSHHNPTPQSPKSSTTLKPCAPHHHPTPKHKRPITINNKTHHKKIHLPTSGLHPPAGYKTHKAAKVGLSWTASQTMGRAVRQTTE